MKFFPFKYVDVYYDERRQLLEYKWKDNAEAVSPEEFKKIIEEILKIIKTYEPRFLLGDISFENFKLTTQFFDWLKNYWLKQVINSGIERFAFVSNNNVFMKTLYKQIFWDKAVSFAFFKDRNVAYQWLITDKPVSKINTYPSE